MTYRLKSAGGRPSQKYNYASTVCFTSDGVFDLDQNTTYTNQNLEKSNLSNTKKLQRNILLEQNKNNQLQATNPPHFRYSKKKIQKQIIKEKKQFSLGQSAIRHYSKSNNEKVKYSKANKGGIDFTKSRILKESYTKMKFFRVGYRIAEGKIKKVEFSVLFKQLQHLEQINPKNKQDLNENGIILINLQNKNSYIQLPQLTENYSLMTIFSESKEKMSSQLKYFGRVLNNYHNSLKNCIFICIIKNKNGAKISQRIFFWIGKPTKAFQKLLIINYIEQFLKEINEKQVIKTGQTMWVLDWFGNHSYFTYSTKRLELVG